MLEEFGEGCIGGVGGSGESRVGSRGREEEREFGEDEACVEVDVSAYGEEGDSTVGGPEGGDVGLRWISIFTF